MTPPSGSYSAVHFLDVGQAHATVAVDRDTAVVIDCPKRGVRLVSKLLAERPRAQMQIIVTHRDLDHCGGVHELLDSFGNASTTLYMNAGMAISPKSTDQQRIKAVIRSILSRVDEVGASTKHALQGESGRGGTIDWIALAPSHRQVLSTAVGGSVNRSSIVLMLKLAQYRFLIPGDIDDIAVTQLLSSNAELSATVLLLPHHGSRLRNLDKLLLAVDPTYAVVSAGRRMSHPAVETLRTIASYNCRVMCTEVAIHCHRDPLDPQHCAGSIAFELRGSTLRPVPSQDDHLVRIRSLDTPVCLGSSGDV